LRRDADTHCEKREGSHLHPGIWQILHFPVCCFIMLDDWRLPVSNMYSIYTIFEVMCYRKTVKTFMCVLSRLEKIPLAFMITKEVLKSNVTIWMPHTMSTAKYWATRSANKTNLWQMLSSIHMHRTTQNRLRYRFILTFFLKKLHFMITRTSSPTKQKEKPGIHDC
jgi:hypothetical protein